MVEELVKVRGEHRKDLRELNARYKNKYEEIHDSLIEKVGRGNVGIEEIVLAIVFRCEDADVNKVRNKVRTLDKFLRRDPYVYCSRKGETERAVDTGGFDSVVVGTSFVPLHNIYFGKQNGLKVNSSLDVFIDFDEEYFYKRIEGLSSYEQMLRKNIDLFVDLDIWEIMDGEIKDESYTARRFVSRGHGFTNCDIYVGDRAIEEMRKVKGSRDGYDVVDSSDRGGDRIMKILRERLRVKRKFCKGISFWN